VVQSTLRTPEILSLADKILALNMLQVVELQTVLAERTGANLASMQAMSAPAAAPVAAAAAPAAEAKAEAAVSEQTSGCVTAMC
jgi:hypothetical protein